MPMQFQCQTCEGVYDDWLDECQICNQCRTCCRCHLSVDAWDEPTVETMFGETHYYCPFCNSECVQDYCWVCQSELGTWRKNQDVDDE